MDLSGRMGYKVGLGESIQTKMSNTMPNLANAVDSRALRGKCVATEFQGVMAVP